MDPEIAGHSRFLSKDCQSLVRVPTNHGGMSLLLQAVNAGNTNMVKCMINKGVNLDERDRNQHYCLHYAIWRKNLEMVKILLESEVCVNYEHPRNYCPLKTAVAEGDLAIVKLLIDAGANVNSSCGREHPTALTALHIAVQLQPAETRLAMVKLLLSHGANVNAPDKLKSSVLSTAIRFRFLNVIETLVLHGAKGDIAKNGLQHTAFQCAILNGNEAVVRIFLEENLDLDLGSKRLLPLHLALRNSDKGVIKALLDSGRFRIDKGDDFGVTALHRSVKNQSLKDIKILLKRGARVSTVNYRDESPLYSAIMIDSDDIVDLLLGRNKDPHVKTILFHNALKICYLLSERNQTRIAKSFIREIALYRNSDQILNGIEVSSFIMHDEWRASFYNECISEISFMKDVDLCDSFTFYEFLTRKDFESFPDGNEIILIFRKKNQIEDLFPIYCDRMLMQYDQFWGKLQLREDAKGALEQILQLKSDPYHIIFKNILCRLRKKDLCNLRDI